MSEPDGETVEGTPWDEARPPHLPDRLTAIPRSAWPFLVLAVVVALTRLGTARFLSEDLVGFGIAIVGGVPAIVGCLLGAALFLRHPDARRSMPLLVVGVTLLALEQIVGLVTPLASLPFDADVALDGGMPTSMLVSSIIGLARSAIGVFGVLYIAAGLDHGRLEGSGPRRGALSFFIVVSLVVVLGTALEYLRIVATGLLSGSLWLVVVALIVGAAELIALSYAAAIFVGARTDREPPAAGWALAMVWAVALIGAAALRALGIGAIWLGLLDNGLVGATFNVSTVVTAVAWLALLAAFALGLPATDAIEREQAELSE